MHAFSYSIKNIISFRGIVLPPPLPEDAKDQSGRSIPRFNFYPTTRISVLLPAAPFPSFLHPLSSRFTCFSSPWPISVALTTGASQPRSFPLLPLSRVLCHPRSLVLSLSFFVFLSVCFPLARPSRPRAPGAHAEGEIFSPRVFSSAR